MRIYIPATSADIGREALLPRAAHAVTADLRTVMPEEDNEVLEAVAMCAAADDSLRILSALAASGERISPLRVVIAADVYGEEVGPATGEDDLPTAVHLLDSIGWERVSSFHVDDSDIADLLVQAIEGDDDAFEKVAEEDLMWFDAAEHTDLIEYFS